MEGCGNGFSYKSSAERQTQNVHFEDLRSRLVRLSFAEGLRGVPSE